MIRLRDLAEQHLGDWQGRDRATFFVDGSGFVRWHDVSFEPFQDAKFLLEEARRLLTLPTTH